ncbi:hypothetical protein EXM30_04870 [Clostridium botulinum]|uniref:hypothetical protein n=1 Tax=Clostridium botulinum TaxID=1491 RepID=UPI0007DFB3D2|nr:hypothetical protein [Clostridium botulinum]KEI82847.1 hypothetical protein N487_01495 [Clostridium botulinum B2 331]NFA89739.1 hypothetical protein [Clostridium botulinum]NFB20046.1 hypothetical protein [Clostridium botulinum]NFI38448.1 hypothetical protein [Clostridium botulinum]NFT56278.1 hypothetical protein [Clostridium botulinum]
MKNTFLTYKNEMREIRRNECNLLLNYILKFTDTCHRWKGNLDQLISILNRFRKSLEGDSNKLEYFSMEYIFETELKKIRPNLNIRGITVFTSRKNAKTHVVINKNLEDDFSGYYLCEEYMYKLFN